MSSEDRVTEPVEASIVKLIEKIESMQKDFRDLSGQITQLLVDIRTAIYEIENPFSYMHQMRYGKPASETPPSRQTDSSLSKDTEESEKENTSVSKGPAIEVLTISRDLVEKVGKEKALSILDLLSEQKLISEGEKEAVVALLEKSSERELTHDDISLTYQLIKKIREL